MSTQQFAFGLASDELQLVPVPLETLDVDDFVKRSADVVEGSLVEVLGSIFNQFYLGYGRGTSVKGMLPSQSRQEQIDRTHFFLLVDHHIP